jgi:HlyD family secretion protein
LAKIRCNLLPDQVFDGVVTRIEGAADLQRNTLQAKVRIESPSEKLRPEMLCRVEFFEIPILEKAADNVEPEGTGVSVYVPQSAIYDESIWVCDPDTMRSEKRVVIASAKREDLIRIDEGILPGEWVIVDSSGVKAGQRLKPIFKEK